MSETPLERQKIKEDRKRARKKKGKFKEVRVYKRVFKIPSLRIDRIETDKTIEQVQDKYPGHKVIELKR